MLLPVFSLSAQVVSTTTSYPVIDLSALSPLGALLSYDVAVYRCTQMNKLKPDNTTSVSAATENGEWNAKMSVKFQIMRTDRSTGTDWANAWALCKSYSSESGSAGQWRLPTQRELQMIWILHPQLIGKEGFSAFSASYYWSAMEYNANDAWIVDFSKGGVGNFSKANTYWVRCVRDLP